MKVIIAKDAGYCFGVRDAVDMAYDIAKKEGEVYMLGDIVHNEKVVNDLSNAGAKVVDSLDDIPENSTVLFRAHGTKNDIWEDVKDRALNVKDATCPLVYQIHKDVKEVNCIKPGFVNTADYMTAGDIFCMPAEKEGLGTPLLEALVIGLPVVANNAESNFLLCPFAPAHSFS